LLSEVAKHLFRYFYAKIGAPEVWVMDRDTRRPQLYVLTVTGYEELARDPEG